MKKRTLLVISIFYNISMFAATLIPLYLEEKEYGEVTRDTALNIGLPAIPLIIIGMFMIGIAVSPNKDGSDQVTKKSVISGSILTIVFSGFRLGMSGIVLAVGFMGYRLGMSMIGD